MFISKTRYHGDRKPSESEQAVHYLTLRVARILVAASIVS